MRITHYIKIRSCKKTIGVVKKEEDFISRRMCFQDLRIALFAYRKNIFKCSSFIDDIYFNARKSRVIEMENRGSI